MAATFGPRSNRIARGIVVAAAAAVVGLPVLLMLWVRTPFHLGQFYPQDQPVRFDHRLHSARNGIDCLYCHSTADRAAPAGMPPTAVCWGCHVQIVRYVPLLEPVRISHETGRPLAWNRIHNLPDFVYFNHAIHTTGGVGCVTCHGRVDLMPRVVQVAPLTMAWCLDCHRAPARYVRPLERVTDMEWTPGRARPEAPRAPGRGYGVTELTTCTACHR